MTCDTWHVTCFMWHVTPGGRWTFSQNFRSLAHTDWEWRCFEDLEEKDMWLKELMSDEGVYRTAPASPGLLKDYVAQLKRIQCLWLSFFLCLGQVDQSSDYWSFTVCLVLSGLMVRLRWTIQGLIVFQFMFSNSGISCLPRLRRRDRLRLCLAADGAALRGLRQEVQARLLHLPRATGRGIQHDGPCCHCHRHCHHSWHCHKPCHR